MLVLPVILCADDGVKVVKRGGDIQASLPTSLQRPRLEPEADEHCAVGQRQRGDAALQMAALAGM
jgi:hypothetical protein